MLTGARLRPGELVVQESAYYRQEGRRLQEQGDLAGALTAYQKAVLVNPKYADAFNDLGVILESLKDAVNAQFSYERALSIRPAFAAAHTNLALLHEKAGRLEQAAEHWNARIRLGPPDDPWVLGARQKLAQHNLPVSEIPTKRGKPKAGLQQPKAASEAKAAVPAKSEPPKAMKVEPPRFSAPSPDAKALAKSLALEKNRNAKEQARLQKAQAQRERENQKRAQQALRLKERETRSQAKEAKARWEAQRALEKTPKRPLAAAPSRAAVPPSAPAAPKRAPARPKAGPPSQAEVLARDLVKEKAKTRERTIQELLKQGKAAMKARRYEEAASNLKGILLLDPNHRKAVQWLGQVQAKLAREAKLKPLKVISIPTRSEAKGKERDLSPKGEISRPGGLEMTFPEAREISPRAAPAQTEEAKLEAQKVRAEVQEARKQAEQVRSQVEEARRELGEMRRQMEETRRLQAVPPAAAASGPPSPSADQTRQAALEKQGRVRELYERGVDQMRRGLFEEAQSSFQEILTLDPQHEEARQGLQRAQKVLAKAGRT